MKTLLTIPERMHTVAEVAELSGHERGYVVRLIEAGTLEAIRPENPRGGRGQWRIYPASLRQWLKCPTGPSALRTRTRRMQREASAFAAMTNFPEET